MSNERAKRSTRDRVRGAVPANHEITFIMKLGKLSRDQALALIKKHDGDRERIYAELGNRKS